MEYSPEELSKVKIKKNGRGIHELPIHLDLIKEVPDLALLDNFTYPFTSWGNSEESRIIARNKIIRYINLMYSKELTCIKNKYPTDLKSQKAECAILAGFEPDPGSGKFQPKVEEMLSGQNDIINRMIVCFVRQNYPTRFMAIVLFREKCAEGMIRLMKDPNTQPEDLKKWGAAIKDLENMEMDLLNGETNEHITAALVMKVEEETLGLRPEDIAHKRKEGRPPLDLDYYG